MRLYAWTQIALLPLRFFVSEFFMFNREQLVWIAKFNRVVCLLALGTLAMTLVSIVTAQTGNGRIVQELDRHDRRITNMEEEVKAVRIDQAITNTTLHSMSEKMNAGIGLLGVIATTLLCQFAAAVFKMKWGNALRDTIAQEHDRRKIHTGVDE